MKKKYLNKNNELDAKKIAKFVENIYKDVLKMTEETCISENEQVRTKCMMINIKLIDLFQDLYEQPDDEQDMTLE
jgi:hypothetical protein